MKTVHNSVKKYAIVTGAARGIGHAISEALLKDDLRVIVTDIDGDLLERTDFCNAKYESDIIRVCCDVSDLTQVTQLFETAGKHFGSLNVLVNNAGIQTHSLVEEMSEQLWDQTLAVNLKSVFMCSKNAIQLMKKAHWGRIINIASMSSVRGSFRHAHYCASKAGIIGFTKALAIELGEYNITVNAVNPGIIETRMIEETMKYKRERWLKEMSLKRFGRPEDIANMVAFLASEKASWVTGQSIHVNGGILTP